MYGSQNNSSHIQKCPDDSWDKDDSVIVKSFLQTYEQLPYEKRLLDQSNGGRFWRGSDNLLLFTILLFLFIKLFLLSISRVN